jgi:hypothetical protein
VEAEIQFVRGDLWGYGIVVRGTDRGGYWVGVNTDCRPNCHVVIAADSSMSSFINFGIAKKASKLDNDWHTYRVEVVDNTITFLIDGKTVLKTTDNTFLEAGRVGMFDYGTQINVRSFRVIAL